MEKDCLKTETKKEKVLMIVCAILFVLGIILAIVLIVISVKPAPKLCETKGCLEAAARILSNMNSSVDPCDNFYDYVCGRYNNKKIISECQSSSVEDEMFSNQRDVARALIEQPEESNQPSYYKKVKDYYASCMNTTQLSALGNEPIKTLLGQLGGYPIIEDASWDENIYDWTNTLDKINERGMLNAIFEVFVKMDYNKTFKNFVHIAITRYLVDYDENQTEVNFNDTRTQCIFHLLVNISVFLGADRNVAEKDVRDVIKFAGEIAKNQNENHYDDDETVMLIKNMHRIFPAIDWVKFFNKYAFPVILTGDDEVVVFCPRCFAAMSRLMTNTKRRTIANYIISHEVLFASGFLDEKLLSLKNNILYEFDLAKELTLKPRVERCVQQTSGEFSVALFAMFVHSDLVKKSSVSMTEEIFKNIKNELLDKTHKISWFDAETKKIAKNKVNNLEGIIGYAKEILDDKFVSNYYHRMIVKKDQFLSNGISGLKRQQYHRLHLLTGVKEDTKIDAFNHFFHIDIHIEPTINSINVPVTALKDVYFNPSWPSSLKYGAIGSLIGNKLINAIDSKGRHYDAKGNPIDWWSSETSKKYKKIEDCVESQIENMEVPYKEEMIDFPEALRLGFSTILGTWSAYKAYTKWEKANGENIQLPGLELNGRQLFWTSMANLWCAVEFEEFELIDGDQKYDPTKRFKVLGPVINSPEFAKDFNCPTNSNMNPKNKCEMIKK